MIFLKLHKLNGTPFILNMANVDEFESDGAGHTEFVYSDVSTARCKESYEEVESMLNEALLGAKQVIALEDVGAFVR